MPNPLDIMKALGQSVPKPSATPTSLPELLGLRLRRRAEMAKNLEDAKDSPKTFFSGASPLDVQEIDEDPWIGEGARQRQQSFEDAQAKAIAQGFGGPKDIATYRGDQSRPELPTSASFDSIKGGEPIVGGRPWVAANVGDQRTPLQRQRESETATALAKLLLPEQQKGANALALQKGAHANTLELLNNQGGPGKRDMNMSINKEGEASFAEHVPTQPQLYYGRDGKPHALAFNKGKTTEIPLPEGMAGKTNPLSSSVRDQANKAAKVMSHIDQLKEMATQLDAKGLIGPIGSRWTDFLQGKIGSTELAADPETQQLISRFRAGMGLMSGGMAMVHGGLRGGASPTLVKRFDEYFNAKNMDLNALIGGLEGGRDWMKTYADLYGEGTPGKPTSSRFELVEE